MFSQRTKAVLLSIISLIMGCGVAAIMTTSDPIMEEYIYIGGLSLLLVCMLVGEFIAPLNKNPIMLTMTGVGTPMGIMDTWICYGENDYKMAIIMFISTAFLCTFHWLSMDAMKKRITTNEAVKRRFASMRTNRNEPPS